MDFPALGHGLPRAALCGVDYIPQALGARLHHHKHLSPAPHHGLSLASVAFTTADVPHVAETTKDEVRQCFLPASPHIGK